MNESREHAESVGQLPVADASMRAHSEQLQGRVRESIIAAGGVIGFDQFMHMALYEPGLGYYTSGLRKFGRDGDFITAPEISPLFGRCLAHFSRKVLACIEHGNILEFGAGSGRMAATILSELEALQALPDRYQIIEVSAELQRRQHETLQAVVPQLLDRVEWLTQLPAQGFTGVVLANELLDAMPLQRFTVSANGLRALGVSWCEERRAFEIQAINASDELQHACAHIQQTTGVEWPSDYTSELSLTRTAWVASVAEHLEQGALLMIDYGYGRAEYYHPERNQGTLMCHYRHRAHEDPLQYIGLQDITSYVDFTAIAEAVVENGMELLGYTTQCGFLLENGLQAMIPDANSSSQTELLQFSQQVKTLTLPSEMGERFKVMLAGKGIQQELPGFRLQDQRGRL